MPIDYKKYAKNWKTEIRPAVLKRANSCCELCDIENYAIGIRQFDGTFSEMPKDTDVDLQKFHAEAMGFKIIKIVLTIAHLDHDINNNDMSNLMAMCQKCHLGYDKKHHIKNASNTRKLKSKQIDLF